MTPRERVFALEHFGIKLGLANINRLLEALDRPDRAWLAIHVAGTNGKGSVTAMVERGLRAAGHKTGRYTSPHLSAIEERITINGTAISRDDFDTLAADVLAVVDRLRASRRLRQWPTFFEVTTAIAFEAFRRAGVQTAVVEVGLGGRFDATNVLTPAVSAITSIALDHERHLGQTLGEIAFEKAGIIKPGVPVVTGDLVAPAREVIRLQALKIGAPQIETGRQHVASVRTDRGRASIVLNTPVRRYDEVRLGLNGAHQIDNAAIAARTLELCSDRGIDVAPANILTALSAVEWPARLEWLQLDSRQHVLIDAAHNPAGAKALADYVVAAAVAPIPLVIAVMQDKDVEAIVQALAPVVSSFIATDAGTARSLRAPVLAARISRATMTERVTSCPDVDRALAMALAENGRAMLAGSIFLVGPARARLITRGAVAVPYPT